jgi:hypothetical protein
MIGPFKEGKYTTPASINAAANSLAHSHERPVERTTAEGTAVEDLLIAFFLTLDAMTHSDWIRRQIQLKTKFNGSEQC